MPTARNLSPMQSSIESEYDAEEASERGSGGSDGRLSSVRERARWVFSPKAFLVAVVAAAIGMFAVGGLVGTMPIPFLGSVGGLLGLFTAAFAVGLVRSRRQYLEVTLAGALVTAVTFTFSTLTAVFLPIGVDVLQEWGVAIAGAGAVLGGVVSLLGHYFGRDLRDGLTREI